MLHWSEKKNPNKSLEQVDHIFNNRSSDKRSSMPTMSEYLQHQRAQANNSSALGMYPSTCNCQQLITGGNCNCSQNPYLSRNRVQQTVTTASVNADFPKTQKNQDQRNIWRKQRDSKSVGSTYGQMIMNGLPDKQKFESPIINPSVRRKMAINLNPFKFEGYSKFDN